MRIPSLMVLTAAGAALAAGAGAQSIVNSFPVPPSGAAFVGGLEYDPISDTIWVVDETNDLIQQFDRAGNVLRSFAPYQSPLSNQPTNTQPIGVAVDPSTGNLWVGDEGEVVYELRPDGTPTGVEWVTTPSINDVSGLAFDPVSRHIFISKDSSPQTIGVFDMMGNSITTIPLAGTGSADPDGLAYNPVTGHFYLGEDTGDQILEVDGSGNLVQSFAMGVLGISPEGLGVDTINGRMFIGDGFVTRMVYEVSGIVSPCGSAPITVIGAGCADSGGTVPTVRVDACPKSGTTVYVGEHTSYGVTAPALFLVGLSTINLPLNSLGAPGCTIHVLPDVAQLGPFANAGDRAGLSIPIPGGLAGATVNVQAINFPDTGANPANLSVSDAVTIVIQ